MFDELAADYLMFNPGRVPSETTMLELMAWSHLQTLDPVDDAHRVSDLPERAAYIIEHADSIMVSVKIADKRETYALSDLRGRMAIREAFRMLIRAEVPHRVLHTEQEAGNPS
jgi:hypothetical protein